MGLIFFLILILIAALSVILSKNVIQSVLYLVLVFLLCSLLLVYLGADFIGLIILIIYIGAIAVLFLFVVMMLNIRILEIISTFSIYLSLAIFLSLIFLSLILLIYWNSIPLADFHMSKLYTNWALFNNIKIVAIGQLLFNELFILFIGATLLLFIAMIGAIILTLNKKKYINYDFRVIAKAITWKVK